MTKTLTNQNNILQGDSMQNVINYINEIFDFQIPSDRNVLTFHWNSDSRIHYDLRIRHNPDVVLKDQPKVDINTTGLVPKKMTQFTLSLTCSSDGESGFIIQVFN